MRIPMLIAGGALTLAHSAAADGNAGPPVVGTWQTYSDKTGDASGVVRTYIQEGKLNGYVVRLRPGSPDDTKCVKCSGSQKDKPILGLVVMWGLQPDGDSWSGGTILDPDNGTTYKCVARFVAPDKLDVRGYIGISLFGRTQTWRRMP